MKRHTLPNGRIFRFALCMIVGPALFAGRIHAQVATQSITLTEGWNAIWLEPEPVQISGPDAGQPMAPPDVFDNPAIQVVTTPKPLAGDSEIFGEDPGTIGTFNQDQWQSWKKVDLSATNNLPIISGNRPYLVQVEAGTPTFSLDITGKVRFFRPSWVADRYNLVGFGLQGAPTFQSFFGPSGTKHPINRIFRLNPAGNWEAVTGSQTMLPHQAYWVFCSGASNYMGPVAVDFSLAKTGEMGFTGPSDVIAFGTGVDEVSMDLQSMVFTNLGASVATPSMDLVSEDGNAGDLLLRVVVTNASGLGYDLGNQVDSSVGGGASPLGKTVPSLASSTITLGAQRLWSTGPVGRTNLYRLTTGMGSAFYLPVSALRSSLDAVADLSPTASSSVAGLWVGDVKVTAATSIVENGSPIRATAGSAPMRILFHSDNDGAVSLLSQVTMMQTRTADPEVAPVPVLVVDPAKLPFFEGIKERNGKQVGVRFATVSYDMPRNTTTTAQSGSAGDLLDAIVTESTTPGTNWADGAGLYTSRSSVTGEAIESYLLFRSIRPPSLKEVYKLSLPLTGAMGAGKTVKTIERSLTLDPFHRSNPFRHAYHQSEGRGPQITREIEITFNGTQSSSDLLIGTTKEILHGLAKSDLVVTGTVELRRISSVPVLDTAP